MGRSLLRSQTMRGCSFGSRSVLGFVALGLAACGGGAPTVGTKNPKEVRGEYRPVPPPVRGSPTKDAPATFAVVALKDGTRGTLHRYMPSKGQGLLAPCVSGAGMILSGEA